MKDQMSRKETNIVKRVNDMKFHISWVYRLMKLTKAGYMCDISIYPVLVFI